MYSISRDFTFCYGHRLLNYEGKCCHLHGHNAKVRLTVTLEQLNETGMVRDFAELKNIMGQWLDQNWDHRMILSKDDPLVNVLQENQEPIFVLESNPTAENLAYTIFQVARNRLKIPVQKVEFWETDKSFATFSLSDFCEKDCFDEKKV